MKKIFFYIIIISSQIVYSQNSFHNVGDIQMHTNAKIGFHTDLVNDGTFDLNQGFVGFYNFNGGRKVSGLNEAIFYDIEVDVRDNLELFTSLGVTNELNFITGKIVTPRNNRSVLFDFIAHDMYFGEDDDRYIDGYASVISSQNFNFPIGDDFRLRPLILLSIPSLTDYYEAAYFYENPNSPTFFSSSFDTTAKEIFLDKISRLEFWDLNGTQDTEVTLTWDEASNVAALVDNINFLRVVGWNIINNQWSDLGNITVSGDLIEGTITSSKFNPNDYEVLTIGSAVDSNLGVNYSISPNDDGINDFFVIPGIENQGNTYLEIYNRWGAIVYKSKDYKNDWYGIADDNGMVVDRKKGVPDGTYFYILKLENKNTVTGWIYIRR